MQSAAISTRALALPLLAAATPHLAAQVPLAHAPPPDSQPQCAGYGRRYERGGLADPAGMGSLLGVDELRTAVGWLQSRTSLASMHSLSSQLAAGETHARRVHGDGGVSGAVPAVVVVVADVAAMGVGVPPLPNLAAGFPM